MKVEARIALPENTPITLTVRGTLSDFLKLRENLTTDARWSALGGELVVAIDRATTNLKTTAEQEVQGT